MKLETDACVEAEENHSVWMSSIISHRIVFDLFKDKYRLWVTSINGFTYELTKKGAAKYCHIAGIVWEDDA